MVEAPNGKEVEGGIEISFIEAQDEGENDDNFVLTRAGKGRARSIVVFVHGLGGSEATWADFPRFVHGGLGGAPKDSAVFCYYKGLKSLFWFRPSPDVRARQLASHLTRISNLYEEIYLIGHSLGGLIAEDAIRKFHQQKRGTFPEVGVIAGLVIYGSPRLGSIWIKGWAAIFLKESRYLSRHSQVQSEIEEFFSNHIEVNVDSTPSVGRVFLPRYACVGTSDHMVDKVSAAFGVREAQVKLLDCGHRRLVKPGSESAPSASWLGDVLSEIASRRQEWRRVLAEASTEISTTTSGDQTIYCMVTELLADLDLGRWVEVYNDVRERLSSDRVAIVDSIAAPKGIETSVLIAIQKLDRLVQDDHSPRPLLLTLGRRYGARNVSLMVASPLEAADDKATAMKNFLRDTADIGSPHRLASSQYENELAFGDDLFRWISGIIAADPRRKRLLNPVSSDWNIL